MLYLHHLLISFTSNPILLIVHLIMNSIVFNSHTNKQVGYSIRKLGSMRFSNLSTKLIKKIHPSIIRIYRKLITHITSFFLILPVRLSTSADTERFSLAKETKIIIINKFSFSSFSTFPKLEKDGIE